MNSIIIFCAKYLTYIILVIAIVWWITLQRAQKTKFVIFGIITAVVAYILAKIGGALFYDARPFVSDHVKALVAHAADNGFPSDHTLLLASLAVAAFFISKKWGIGFLVGALIVGGSRVLANIHHPIDIIGSLVFAAIGGIVAYFVTPKILQLLAKSKLAKFLGLETQPARVQHA